MIACLGRFFSQTRGGITRCNYAQSGRSPVTRKVLGGAQFDELWAGSLQEFPGGDCPPRHWLYIRYFSFYTELWRRPVYSDELQVALTSLLFII